MRTLIAAVMMLAAATDALAAQKALIDGTRVAQVVPVGQEFAVAPPHRWVDAPDEVRDGWTYVDGVFTPPPAPPAAYPRQLTAFRDGLPGVFGGSVTRMTAAMEAYPPLSATYAMLLLPRLTLAQEAFIAQVTATLKARIDQANAVLTADEYAALKTLADAQGLGDLVP